MISTRPVYEKGKYEAVIICNGFQLGDIGCGHVVLTDHEYIQQMNKPDLFWICPLCGCYSLWDDENSDLWYGKFVEV